MNTERITCEKKLGEFIQKFLSPGTTAEINTSKGSACSTPVIDSVELRNSDGSFLILGKGTYSSELSVSGPVTPKMVKKIRISGKLAGEVVFKTFRADESTYQFENALEDVVKVEFEEAENG